MKKIKTVLWIALILMTIIPIYAQQYDSEKDFQFKIGKDRIEITKYIGSKKEVSIPISIQNNPVTVIGKYAFKENQNINKVIIPDSVTSIEYGAFEGCISLTNVNLPNSVTSIGGCAFYECKSLINIIIPNNVTGIGYGAFEGCTSLTAINVNSNNTNYSSDQGILYNKNKTLFLVYPAGKTGTTFVIPNSVTGIWEGAFHDCTGLISITIPNSVTSIGEWAFYNCTSLTAINVNSGNMYFSSDQGVLYNRDKTKLIKYPQAKAGAYNIPNSVTSIEEYAFYDCKSITSITIPNSVNNIDEMAFYNCTSLASVTFQGTITSSGIQLTGTGISPFLGDLRDKYLAGGKGTYKTTAPVDEESVWTKQ